MTNFGLPADLTWYRLLTDWGSLISGGLALVAGGAAYFAGVYQARATRAAAQLQIDAIKEQRNDEIVNVREAVRIEITAFVKYIVGAVGLCEQIAKGTVKIPRQDARYIAKNFWADPVVYPAVADRIGLLPQPHATVQFYMRISEAKGMVEALRTKTDPPSITYNSAIEFVTPVFAASVADSLITALQLARPIVGNDGDHSTSTQLEAWVNSEMVRQIDSCLVSAKATFPNAESFRDPNAA